MEMIERRQATHAFGCIISATCAVVSVFVVVVVVVAPTSSATTATVIT